jgi:hypothetical protein
MPDELALLLVAGAVLVGLSATQNSVATGTVSPVVTGQPGTTSAAWVTTVVPTGAAAGVSVVPTGVGTLAPDLAVRQKPTVDTHRRALATVLPTVAPTDLVSAPTVAVVPAHTVAVVPAPTVPVEPAHTVTVVPAPKVAVVRAPTAPPGMDTRFVYVSGAGITAAYSANSVGVAPSKHDGAQEFLLVERSGYQRRDYVLEVVVDCSKLPATERDLVSVHLPSGRGDPDIYFVPGAGVSARENQEARTATVAVPRSGLATITYTILGTKDTGSLEVSAGASERVPAHVSWSTGADNKGHVMLLVHDSVLSAGFFWAQ